MVPINKRLVTYYNIYIVKPGDHRPFSHVLELTSHEPGTSEGQFVPLARNWFLISVPIDKQDGRVVWRRATRFEKCVRECPVYKASNSSATIFECLTFIKKFYSLLNFRAAAAEAKKRSKYSVLQGRIDFRPVSWQHWAFRPSATELFDSIASRIRAKTGDPGARTRLYRRIAAAVQIGNAACIVEAHSRASTNWFEFYHQPLNFQILSLKPTNYFLNEYLFPFYSFNMLMSNCWVSVASATQRITISNYKLLIIVLVQNKLI